MKIWVEVSKKRNLEATIQRVLQDNHVKQSAEARASEQRKAEKALDKKERKRKCMRRLAWVFLGLCVCLLIGLTIVQAVNNAQLSVVDDLQDTRLISYESQILTVKRLALLFSINDEQSYQNAKAAISMSSELKAIYFVNEHYYGDTDDNLSVEIDNILYEITSAPQARFLVYLTRRTSSGSKQYILQAAYTGNTLVDLKVLN